MPAGETRVRTRRRSLNKHRLGLLGVAGVLGLLIAGVLMAAVYIYPVNLGYQIVAAEKEVARMEKENQMLRLEVAKYRSLDRVETIAVGKLKMQRPQEGKVMFASVPLAGGSSTSSTVAAAQGKPSSSVVQTAASLFMGQKNAVTD